MMAGRTRLSERRRGAARLRVVAVMLAMALLGPPGLVGFGAQAQVPDPDDVDDVEVEVPFWRLLRADVEEDEGEVQRWTDADLNGVHFVTDEIGYAVGGRTPPADPEEEPECQGVVLRTEDGGDIWETWALTGVGCLNEVHVVKADEPGGEHTVVAVGAEGAILRSSDGGERWFRIPTPEGTVDLHGVHFPSSDTGYAVGDDDTVLKSQDGGRSWRRLSGASGANLKAVQFSDPDHGIAVGGSKASGNLASGGHVHTVIRTEDGGKSWETTGRVRESPYGLDGIALLEGDGGSIGYAVGSGFDPNQIKIPGLGPPETFRSVLRSADGFESATAEYAVTHLRGVTGYRTPATIADVSEDEVDATSDEAIEVEEFVHAVGVESGLPVAVTRRGAVMRCTPPGNADDFTECERRNDEQPREHRGWVVEPIEGWSQLLNEDLLSASASPGGETIVAVGTNGLMLRRTTDPDEATETVCVPPELAEALAVDGETLLPEAVPVCPREGGARGPDDEKAPEDAVPPTLDLPQEHGRAGLEFVARGEHWLACNDRPSCEPSEVELTFRDQTGTRFPLGTVDAGSDGTFEHRARVPEHAAGGPAAVLAEGQPSPDGGPTAETPFLVREVNLTLSDSEQPGEQLTVSGHGWHACPDFDPERDCTGSTVSVEFRQEGESFELGQVAANDGGTFTLATTVPDKAVAGDAIVRAVGDPTPDGGASAEAVFDVLTECGIPLRDVNPEFPCLTHFFLTQEDGTKLDPRGSGHESRTPSFLGFDPGIGEEDPETGEPAGRLVAVHGTRVFLYDVSTLEQRGVPGFADPFVGDSADGDATGVVNLHDAPEGTDIHEQCQAGCGLATVQVQQAVALDRENHRLFFVAASSPLTVVAVSLAGEFTPTSYRIDAAAPLSRITHLAVDPGHGMLYAVTTAANADVAQVWATTVPQSDVFVHAIPTRVEDGAMSFGRTEDDPPSVPALPASGDGAGVSCGEAVAGEEMTCTARGLEPDSDADWTATFEHEGGEEPDQQIEEGRVTADGEGAAAFAVAVPDDPGAEYEVRVEGTDADGGAYQESTSGEVTAPENGGESEAAWSLSVGDQCSSSAGSTWAPEGLLGFFGLSEDGRRLHLPCAATNLTFRGTRGPRPNGILTVTLPEEPAPDELGGADLADIVAGFAPVPGSGMGTIPVNRVFGDQMTGVLMWRAGDVVLVWDLDRAMWLGRSLLRDRANLVAADPATRQLYLNGGSDIPAGSLASFQVENLPGDFHRRDIPTGVENSQATFAPELTGGAFDPGSRRLVSRHAGGLKVLEDRIPPTISREAADPDDATHDIDEADAFSVDRGGATSAYGMRVWSTGLRGALPGTYAVRGDGPPSPVLQASAAPGSAALTYDWLFRSSTSWGPHTSRLPTSWRPHAADRELFSARVLEATLDADERALTGRSPRRAVASAVGLGVGEGTDGDIHQRRGAREWRSVVDSYVADPCFGQCGEQWSQHWQGEEAGRFDDCADEGYDRLLREVDGDRQVHLVDEGDPDDPTDDEPDPCFPFDDDPRDDPEGLGQLVGPEGGEQRVGWTQASACVAEGGDRQRGASTRGSSVACDLDEPETVAVAEQAFGGGDELFVELPGGVMLRVEASFTLTRSFLDPERGMVSEANAFTQGVELALPGGTGGLRIGQVATRAETWAKGTPGSADSEFTVSYSDVELTGPDGAQLFACDPRDDVTLAGGPLAECDVEDVVRRANQAFGGVVEFSVPARDVDERTAGTPAGARARVQRERRDYWNDRVLFGVDRDEVSGLQMQVVGDGTDFNRYRVDLAGVFAASGYQIGQPFEGLDELPGALEVSLRDHAGTPLRGGHFEVVAADGRAVRSCVTGFDGVGDCFFSSLEPGNYLVQQTSAPDGYLRQADPASVTVSRGLTSTLGFVNVPDGAAVEITLVNPAGEPLAGGVFELAHEAGGSAQCTTDAEGRCELTRLPLGAYTLSQPTAPEGYEPTDPVEFSLLQPGQIARITVVNGPPGSGVGGATVEIIEIIEGAEATSSSDGRGPFGMFRDALADAFAFLLRHPLQALLFLMLFGVLFAPVYGLARRMDLIAAEEAT